MPLVTRHVPVQHTGSTVVPSRFLSHDHLPLLRAESNSSHLSAMKRTLIQEESQRILGLQRKIAIKIHRTEDNLPLRRPGLVIEVVVLQTAAEKRPKYVIGDIPVRGQQIGGLDPHHLLGSEKIKDLELTTEKSDLDLALVEDPDPHGIVALVHTRGLVAVLVIQDPALGRIRREIIDVKEIVRSLGICLIFVLNSLTWNFLLMYAILIMH